MPNQFIHTLRLAVLVVAATLSSSLCCMAADEIDPRDAYLDSLVRRMNATDYGIEKLQIVGKIAHEHYNVDSTFFYSSIMLNMARDLKKPIFEIEALRFLAWSMYYDGLYVDAVRYSLDALVVADSVGNKSLTARVYSDLGNAYGMMHNYTKSTTYYHMALAVMKEIKDYDYLSDLYRNMGESYIDARDFYEAERMFYEALKLDLGRNFDDRICLDYDGLGSVALTRFAVDRFDSPSDSLLGVAKHDFLLSYDSAKKMQNDQCLYLAALGLASTMLYQIDVDKIQEPRSTEMIDTCAMLLNESRDVIGMMGYDSELRSVDVVGCQLLVVQGRYDEAKARLDSLANVAAKEVIVEDSKIVDIYNVYIDYYRAIGDYKGALNCMNKLYNVEMGSSRIDMAIDAAQGMAQNEFEKKIQLREIEERRRESTRKVVAIAMGIVIFLLTALVMQTVISASRRKKAYRDLDVMNGQLKETQKQIESQNHELEERNRQILASNKELNASINYASTIQKAVMPSEALMSDVWGKNVVALRPLHIVSGDFYWTSQVGNLKVLAVGDCTGHGVPGAFLSMLGMIVLEYLSTRIKSGRSVNAGHLLDKMRILVKHALHKNMAGNSLRLETSEEADAINVDNRDGMDVALVVLNTDTMEMHFAGAYRPLVVIRDGELLTWNGDRMPIGDHKRDNQPFTDHVIQMQKNDVVYMYSDGMTDQFGYNENMEVVKYGMQRLHDFLVKIHTLPFEEQKKRIGIEFAYWRMGSIEESNNLYEQTDDALLVGIKL